MEKYKVESDFEHLGLRCVVVMQSLGHRCGYVGVPKGHDLYEQNYDNVYFEVHGGLTYADNEKEYPVKSDLWWFGFDCAHYNDSYDLETAFNYGIISKELYDLRSKTSFIFFGAVMRSKEFCEEECRKLARQIKEYGVKP